MEFFVGDFVASSAEKLEFFAEDCADAVLESEELCTTPPVVSTCTFEFAVKNGSVSKSEVFAWDPCGEDVNDISATVVGKPDHECSCVNCLSDDSPEMVVFCVEFF